MCVFEKMLFYLGKTPFFQMSALAFHDVGIMREKQCIFQVVIAIAEHVETKHGWMSELACMENPIQIEDSS